MADPLGADPADWLPATAASRALPADRADPTPRRERRIRLGSVDEVAAEMAKLYRDMRSGTIPMADGGKLAFVLGQLGRLLEGAALERRLDELEARANEIAARSH